MSNSLYRWIGFGLVSLLFWANMSSGEALAEANERLVRANIQRAAPLLTALKRFKAQQGQYPQYLEQLVPDWLAEIPSTSLEQGQQSVFVYQGNPQAFELFFLPTTGGQELILYSSQADYAQRREPGPYRLKQKILNWGWYQLIPMQTVKLLQQWKGRISLDKSAPTMAYLADAAAIKALWQDWEIKGSPPKINFQKELLLVAAVRSGLVICHPPLLDDRGDLKTQIVATPDAPAFRSYVLYLIPRAGIRSIDGKPL